MNDEWGHYELNCNHNKALYNIKKKIYPYHQRDEIEAEMINWLVCDYLGVENKSTSYYLEKQDFAVNLYLKKCIRREKILEATGNIVKNITS